MSKNPNLTLTGPDLAALLCSRVCHDVISPVGAINNGLELLDEGGADADAMDLIRTSALNASVRLKFARLAFGASGSVGASIDTGEAERAAKDFAAAEKKTEVTWSGPRAIIAKNRVKLLLNLFLVAYSSIPRGGNPRSHAGEPRARRKIQDRREGKADAPAAEVRGDFDRGHRGGHRCPHDSAILYRAACR